MFSGCYYETGMFVASNHESAKRIVGSQEDRGGSMMDPAGTPVFTILKVLSYVSLAAMVGAIVYAAAMALRYWPGISV
jgi:hypothetical protein